MKIRHQLLLLFGISFSTVTIVPRFYRYLLVTDHDTRLCGEQAEVDVVSWDSILQIGNAADYDAWVLNMAAVQQRVPPKLFTNEEIRTLFTPKTILHVVVNGGRIFVIGDLAAGIFTPPSVGGAGPRKVTADRIPTKSSYDPFASLIEVQRDARPVDYRRISRVEEYNYKGIYDYLDEVTKWDYSLVVKKQRESIEVVPLATTNFGTCLAARFRIGDGSLFVLPSLGTTVEADDQYVLRHFLGITAQVSTPAWATTLIVPGQRTIESRLKESKRKAAELVGALDRDKEELISVQRWKRLLYDDSFSLEEIVKESFEALGASVTKRSKEKADFRVAVTGRPACVLEVKGTRKDQFLKKDLRQLSEWMDEAILEGEADVKGAFVGNAAREKAPIARESMFDPNNLAFAAAKKMTLLRTLDLYCLVLLKLTGGLAEAEFWEEFFACVGEFNAEKYRQALPVELSLTGPEQPLTPFE